MTTVPRTKILDVFWSLRSNSSLTATEKWLKEPAASAGELARAFGDSVSVFEVYENENEPFHHTAGADGYAPALRPWQEGERLTRGSRYAAALWAGACVPGLPREVTYVDRELDCLRTSKGSFFDGTDAKTKRAILPDLLLRHPDGFPVLAEVKVGKDKNAVYALIQLLAAAAHLVTPSQRIRLGAQYNRLKVTDRACLDLFVLLHDDPRQSGTAPRLVEAAKRLAGELLEDDPVATHIRCIRLLETKEPAQLIS